MIISFSGKLFSQDTVRFFAPSPEFNKKRFASAVCVQGTGYGGSLALLSSAWYKNYNQTSFHFFDDSKEWLQMDKAGHFVTSWYLGRMGIDMMQWSGANNKKSILYGCAGSFLYLTGLEMLDGFSDGWGFSWSDFSANTLGTGFIITQKMLQSSTVVSPLKRGAGGISLKYSFHQTGFPQYRPSLLGKSLSEQLVKDYNGQTYWLSLNISSFAPALFPSPGGGGTGLPQSEHRGKGHFPKWLNIAFGYGAEGMTGGSSNPLFVDDKGNQITFERYRQYYLSLDIDLTRIKTKSHFIKALAETFSFIKIPAPALEWSKKGMTFHPLYY
ncbi:MAG: DUF2279 domain-containing protein [Bacteroidetes bacterium]|nr:DUF2279 domain-containing protein [Bacteroidota bacterium]